MKLARISLAWLAIVVACTAATAWAEPATTGPVETVQSFQQALSANPPQVEIFWTSLPTSYQTEIRELISTFAQQTDPDLWNAGFRVLGKAAKVARQQDEFLRKSPLFAGFTGRSEGTVGNVPFFTEPKQWGSLVTVFDAIATSEINTYDGLKNLNPERFLATTGTKLAQACIDLAVAAGGPSARGELEQFRGGTFTLVEENGDSATVKYEAQGRPATEIKLTKVDNKWVFAELAAAFQAKSAEARRSVGQFTISAEQKTQCLTLTKAIEAGLDELLASRTQDDFNAASERLAQQFQGLFGSAAATFSGVQQQIGKESAPTITPTESDDKSNDDSDGGK